jgi:subtilisin-like proprotein convertase family protein
MPGEVRAVLGLLAGAWLAACSPRVDYDGTHYRCDSSGTCPDGYSCVDGVCLDGPGPIDTPDAAVFDRPDARDENPLTMLSASSDPDIDIPDGFDQGIWDAVEFSDDCTVVDLTVDVEIYHDRRGDLVMAIYSPSGTEVFLRDGSIDESDEDLVGTYPTTLSPSESLDDFAGEQVAGGWVLRIADVDGDGGDTGWLESWGVNIWCE